MQMSVQDFNISTRWRTGIDQEQALDGRGARQAAYLFRWTGGVRRTPVPNGPDILCAWQ